jgi:murein biosynthesis integral membrane protein MurJ
MNLKKVALGALVVSVGLLIGRVSGFFRELIIANQFGASENSDFIVLLLTTPDFLMSLLMGGAMSLALVPEFKRLNNQQAALLYRQVSTVMLLFGLALVFVGFFVKEYLLRALGMGLDDNFIHENASYFFYSLLALPISLATGASLAYLNSQDRFAVTSLGTLIVNLTIIAFILLAAYLGDGFVYISLGLVVAALLRWLSQVASIGLFPIATFVGAPSLITVELVKRYTYALLSGGIIFALPVVVRTVASTEGPGFLSLVNYTVKLVELPLIVLSSAFSIVLLPKLSSQYALEDEKSFLRSSSLILMYVAFSSILISLALRFHTELVVNLAYGWGALDVEQLQYIVGFLFVYCMALPFQCLNGILLAIFSARRDTKTPFLVTSILGVSLFSYLLVSKPSVSVMLESLVWFYALMMLLFVMLLRIKHNVRVMQGFGTLLLTASVVLLSVLWILSSTQSVLNAWPSLIRVLILGVGVISLLGASLFFVKYTLKNGS